MTEGSTRAVLAALLANLGISIAKFVAFLVTGSASMLAEAVHSVADTSNQALLLLGSRRARRAATPQHPFGYGAERYFWAFIVAMLLFLMGGLFAIYEGAQKWSHPHVLESPEWAIGVLLVALVLEGFSFRTAIVESNRVRGQRSWWSFVRRSKLPELPVVLLEDAGALLGLLFALIGVSLAAFLEIPRLDAAASVAIGVLLCLIAALLAVEMKSLLIGESASADDQETITALLESRPEVRRLIHLRTLHMGPEQLFVGAKIEFDGALDVGGIARAIDATEQAVRTALPSVRFMYVEPDLHDGARRGAGSRELAEGREA